MQEQVIVRKNNLKYRQCIPDFKLERNLSEDDMNKLLKKMRCLPNSKIKYMPF